MPALYPSTIAPIGQVAVSPSALGPPSPLLADNIDPVTRDFRSLTEGADPIDAQVQIAVTVLRASGAAVLEDGMAITATHIDESYRNIVEADVRRALARLVANRDIEIMSFEHTAINEGAQQGDAYLLYRNLRAVGESKPRRAVISRLLPKVVA